MTYEELGQAIAGLSGIDKKRPAVVFPPEGCPATTPVPVTELHVDFRREAVTILTGKKTP